MTMRAQCTSVSQLTHLSKHCVNCGLNNHDSSEYQKPRVQRNSSNGDVVCFQSNGAQEKSVPNEQKRFGAQEAALHQINEFVPRYA